MDSPHFTRTILYKYPVNCCKSNPERSTDPFEIRPCDQNKIPVADLPSFSAFNHAKCKIQLGNYRQAPFDGFTITTQTITCAQTVKWVTKASWLTF